MGKPFHMDMDNPFRHKRMVEDSAELRRILSLPRRNWEATFPEIKLDPRQREWVYYAIGQGAKDDQILAYLPQVQPYLHMLRLEAYLRQPNGKQYLRPVQAASLLEMAWNRGLLMPAAVSAGKTLTSLLSFVVLQSVKPMLILPAKLIDKTEREAAKYRQNWLVPGYVRMISYEKLGRADYANLLEEASPDVIVADECHRLRNKSAASTRRVKRYLTDHEDVVFVGMSGTIMKRSIQDFSHLLEWALRSRRGQPAKTPLPTKFEDLMTWSMALDQKRDGETRLAPGALVEFCHPSEREWLLKQTYDEGIGTVRRAVMRRVMDTPGVVSTSHKQVGSSLRVENVILPLHGKEIQEGIQKLRTEWRRPDGEPLMDGIEFWRYMREVGLGFYYRWHPKPPDEWRERRSQWSAFVRTILSTNRKGIDSELQVIRAIEAHQYERKVLDAWRAVKDQYNPEANKQTQWLDYSVVDWCVKWLRGEAAEMDVADQKGICWVEHTEFGHELSRRAGLPFYGEGGYEPGGRNIEDHKPGTPMIASIGANGEGRNLQGWSTNLITSIPQNGAKLEQLLGRCHRDGQEADEVVYSFLTTVQEQLDSFYRAKQDAIAITDMTGQPQKLTYCDVILHELGSAPKKTGASKKTGS